MSRGMVDAYKEYFCYSFEDLSLTAGSGVAFEDVTVKMDSDSDFEIIKRSHIAISDLIRVKYQDDSYGRQFQNLSMDLRAISGTTLQASGVVDIGQAPTNNFMPYFLPRPYLIRAGTTYTASYADFSGSTNSIRETFHGAKIRQGKAPWDQEWAAKPPYDYTTALNNAPTTIPASGSAILQISVGIDAHFLVQKIVGTRSSGAPALVTIRTGGNDRQWMDKAVLFDNIVGNAQFPNVLPAPRLVERGSTISITIQNLSAVFAGTYEIVFSGLKLF
jgi:hypothetical protein